MDSSLSGNSPGTTYVEIQPSGPVRGWEEKPALDPPIPHAAGIIGYKLEALISVRRKEEVQLSGQNCLVPKLIDSIMSYFVFIYSLGCSAWDDNEENSIWKAGFNLVQIGVAQSKSLYSLLVITNWGIDWISVEKNYKCKPRFSKLSKVSNSILIKEFKGWVSCYWAALLAYFF